MADYIKSTQEQAAAAWITYLNQMRLAELMEKLMTQDVNLENALEEIQKLKDNVSQLIASNRGGDKGLHGFIAEAAEVGISNARNLIRGLKPVCTWINDNGPADIQYTDGTMVQVKFVQENFSIGYHGGLKNNPSGFYDTFRKYPWLVEQGGKYMPPKDFYAQIEKIWNTPRAEAARWTKNDPISFKQWEAVQEFFKTTGTTPEDFKPSLLNYAEVQKGTIDQTINEEEMRLMETDEKIRNEAYEGSKPSFNEAAKVAAVSAALEGGAAFCSVIVRKRKAGKKLVEFTADDWKEVGMDTATSTIKGGIRGSAVYALSNFTATPANVATGLVTAAFGVTAQAKLLREGKIDNEEFLINSEALCLDVTISTISSLLGQVAIPVPVLGAIIGNVAGMFLYDIAKNQGLQKEQAIIAGYQSEIAALTEKLDEQYRLLLRKLEDNFKKFSSMMELAFDVDINTAFESSIQFARFNGVAEDKILKTKAEIDAFFLA